MTELNDEIIVFPFELKKFDKDKELDSPQKVEFGDVAASVNHKEKPLEDMAYGELVKAEKDLGDAFDRYGICSRIERVEKHPRKNREEKKHPEKNKGEKSKP